MREGTSPYDVLGVPTTASTTEVKAAYRRAVRRAHPDAGGSAELFRRVEAAYDVLGDPRRRREYDRRRQDDRREAAAPVGRAPAPAPPEAVPPREPAADARRRHRYLVMMAVCVGLFVLAGGVVRLFSTPAAVVMMVVAMGLLPMAVVMVNRPPEAGPSRQAADGPPDRVRRA
ncbi:MAG TPA: DnaJ domain-containing protein, partial [Frankiaceae bacterium]|nr:DnaJ domain-containing protein [Frankiaceae bacterium]